MPLHFMVWSGMSHAAFNFSLFDKRIQTFPQTFLQLKQKKILVGPDGDGWVRQVTRLLLLAVEVTPGSHSGLRRLNDSDVATRAGPGQRCLCQLAAAEATSKKPPPKTKITRAAGDKAPP